MESDDPQNGVHETTERKLHAIRQRYTAQRRALVELLAHAGQPLTIPQIVVQSSALPQSSLYRNLMVFEQAGVVHRIVTSHEFACYELSEDVTAHHHHHLVCTSCGGVEDFNVPGALEAQINSVAHGTAHQSGFRLRGHRFDLLGTCARCAGPE